MDDFRFQISFAAHLPRQTQYPPSVCWYFSVFCFISLSMWAPGAMSLILYPLLCVARGMQDKVRYFDIYPISIWPKKLKLIFKKLPYPITQISDNWRTNKLLFCIYVENIVNNTKLFTGYRLVVPIPYSSCAAFSTCFVAVFSISSLFLSPPALPFYFLYVSIFAVLPFTHLREMRYPPPLTLSACASAAAAWTYFVLVVIILFYKLSCTFLVNLTDF